MKWEYDECVDEWDLYVDALPMLIEGFENGSGVNVSRDDVPAKPWRATVLGVLLPERWDDVEAAKTAAVDALADQLHKARCEVFGVLSKCCEAATKDGGISGNMYRKCSECGEEMPI